MKALVDLIFRWPNGCDGVLVRFHHLKAPPFLFPFYLQEFTCVITAVRFGYNYYHWDCMIRNELREH